MEETLGKRISYHRKRLGLTQDALAEKMGVTAQAVSKWENDQSCPDIATLPKLAQVFGVTTDALLGIEPAEAVPQPLPSIREGEVEADEDQAGQWELTYNSPRRTKFGFAAWILLAGVLQLLAALNQWDFIGFWSILWSSGLVVFGAMGLYHRFSFFRLGCALFGGYYLLNLFDVLPFSLSLASKKQLLFPIFLLLFGMSLLFDAWKKGKDGEKTGLTIRHGGKNVVSKQNSYHISPDGRFECTNSFGEHSYRVDLPLLTGGTVESSFGELTLDLRGCEAVSDNCWIEASNSFGELEILIPRKYQANVISESSFASIETRGEPSADSEAVIHLNCSSSFGEITIRYL